MENLTSAFYILQLICQVKSNRRNGQCVSHVKKRGVLHSCDRPIGSGCSNIERNIYAHVTLSVLFLSSPCVVKDAQTCRDFQQLARSRRTKYRTAQRRKTNHQAIRTLQLTRDVLLCVFAHLTTAETPSTMSRNGESGVTHNNVPIGDTANNSGIVVTI